MYSIRNKQQQQQQQQSEVQTAARADHSAVPSEKLSLVNHHREHSLSLPTSHNRPSQKGQLLINLFDQSREAEDWNMSVSTVENKRLRYNSWQQQ